MSLHITWPHLAPTWHIVHALTSKGEKFAVLKGGEHVPLRNFASWGLCQSFLSYSKGFQALRPPEVAEFSWSPTFPVEIVPGRNHPISPCLYRPRTRTRTHFLHVPLSGVLCLFSLFFVNSAQTFSQVSFVSLPCPSRRRRQPSCDLFTFPAVHWAHGSLIVVGTRPLPSPTLRSGTLTGPEGLTNLLRFALDYLRMIGNFEKLTDQIRGLPSSVEALMDAVLVYLEGLCTPAVANAVLPLIAVSSPVCFAAPTETRPESFSAQRDVYSANTPESLPSVKKR